MNTKTVVSNRKARHNFIILESVEAGMALLGSEIKSIRAGRVSLGDAYVRPEKGELWLLNAHIARNPDSTYMNHEPMRPRKLLLHKKEIANLASEIREKGLTLIPLRLYLKGGLAKLEVALAKGKRLYDKRDSIARRETARTLERAVKTEVAQR